MLVLADRGFYGFRLCRAGRATGADLCWRAKSILNPAASRPSPTDRGSPRSRPSGNEGRHATPLVVRSSTTPSTTDGHDESYRLFTTILDPTEAPAAALAACYAERWEIESSLDELKTHQRGPRTVLRSKSPELVTQEIWGHLCCHFAIRTLMWEAADGADEDPDRVSFVAALRIARRSVAQRGAFPP